MDLIASLLTPERTLLNLQAANRQQLFEVAGKLFESSHGLSAKQVADSLNQREKLGSTGLGQGIAIPHGRIKGLKQAAGAFLRLAAPMPFDAPDGRPVQLLFILLVPEQATEQHLQILSELAQRFSSRPFREALLAAPDAAATLALFAGSLPHAAD